MKTACVKQEGWCLMAGELENCRLYIDDHLVNYSSSSGYPTIYLNGRNVAVHRYVWEKRYGAIPPGYQIHHKDGNRWNWDISNLELVTASDHGRYHALQHGLGKSNAGRRKDYVSGFCGVRRPIIAENSSESVQFDSICEAARTLGIRSGDICRILKGTRKSAKGWVFRYVTTGKIL